eukprot:CAMPEP_0117420260 /NCGR_PEP_ID=MMETSP0758-20121206/1627_1 /TAXON_ID=63605 /ORGANISM="Percolomonas cosmopolitus, Strain AE-1 (ATCC 50343)" /LENGTH=440 /DNA_ID=CAMNT_0005201757 /DNA_START=3001 /DNA_END=4323 /DNA_ORIENTATION=+
MTLLKFLDCSNLALHIPKQFALSLKSLEQVNLSNTGIKVIPPKFFTIENFDNFLESDEMSDYDDVSESTTFAVQMNEQVSPPITGDSTAPPLFDLNLSFNKLKHIENLNRFSNLKTLNLSHNMLKSFPLSICSLSKLEYLSLSHNESIEFIPTDIKGLTSIVTLIISHCSLTSLPIAFSDLTTLVTMDMSYNNLKYVPTEFEKLENLENVNLSNNAIDEFPLTFMLENWLNLHHINLSFNKIDSFLENVKLDASEELSSSGFNVKVTTPSDDMNPKIFETKDEDNKPNPLVEQQGNIEDESDEEVNLAEFASPDEKAKIYQDSIINTEVEDNEEDEEESSNSSEGLKEEDVKVVEEVEKVEPTVISNSVLKRIMAIQIVLVNHHLSSSLLEFSKSDLFNRLSIQLSPSVFSDSFQFEHLDEFDSDDESETSHTLDSFAVF